MPGSRSLPFSDVLRDGALKPVAELEAIFHSLGLSNKPRIITTCGSGVTAAIISLALAETGRESQLYDGAWAEWGRAESMMPVVTA
jgi:thiosulfate/3-mercaptopyruvate sulfurtransferase